MNWFTRIRRAKEPGDRDAIEAELRDWRIVTIENREQQSRATIRLRVRKPPIPDGRVFGCAVEISWPYDGSDYPDSEVNQQQLAFEAALDDLSGMNGFSELVQVSTGMGKKEWLYYTSDRERFMRDFNALLDGHDPYPIQITFHEDPNWQLWSDVVEAVQSKTS
ncbi:MAG TPA: DUF695 domain-containing protein [Vicinamibacterales bacterium]|nr:DUF695 domain-containing protein [Vicinamibacterales bacterium]